MDVISTAERLEAARAILQSDPAAAQRGAETVLDANPGDKQALLILGVAHRAQGALIESLAILKPLIRTNPDYAEAHVEWAHTQAAIGLTQPAVASLRQAAALEPRNPAIWRALGILLHAAGEPAQADAAFLQQIRHAFQDTTLKAAAAAFDADEFDRGEQILRARLAEEGNDVAALRMLGEVRVARGDNIEGADLLARCLALAPSVIPARHHYAAALLFQGRADEARPHIERLLAIAPKDTRYRCLMASLLAMVGDHRAAITIYQGVLADRSDDAQTWLNLGFSLRAVGRKAEAVAAYREAARVEPSLGQAYWSLANLKTEPFTPAECDTMLAQRARKDISDADRFQMDYALGCAFEQAGDYETSFKHYASGAALKRQALSYSAAQTTAQFTQIRARMTAPFLADRADAGHPDPAPIFVVGLPRAGSTLIEQILASHGQVEGTSELHDISDIARGLGWYRNADATAYLDQVARLPAADLAALGEHYIARTRARRKTSRPFFIDKMPDNFVHIGLIHLILPHAKIIDIRRHPMAAGFAVFKQFFPRGQDFTYDLAEIGAYYRDYATLTAHWDEVLPGRVHRIPYETLVSDPEPEIRRLLAYCGLPFEPACLTPHETRRDITTASSEQVRQPISREAVDHWRSYQPWLGPLRDALEAPY